MLQQTLSYLDNFARFTRKENVEAVERLLSSCAQLSKFERAQLGMFYPVGATVFRKLACRHRTADVSFFGANLLAYLFLTALY